VVHLFDQGFASAFWLGVLLAFALRFALSFRADYQCNRLSTIIHFRTLYFWKPQHEREPVGRLVRLY